MVDSSAVDSVTEPALADSAPDVASVCACMPDSSSFAQLDTDKVSERIQGDPPRVLEVPPAQVFNSQFFSFGCSVLCECCHVYGRTQNSATNSQNKSPF